MDSEKKSGFTESPGKDIGKESASRRSQDSSEFGSCKEISGEVMNTLDVSPNGEGK